MNKLSFVASMLMMCLPMTMMAQKNGAKAQDKPCLLYTSDAADER